MPAVVSDYVPRGIQVPVRAGVLGLSVLTAVGLTKLALTGAVALPPILPLGPFRQPAAGSRHRCSLCYPCVAFTVPVLPTLSALRLPLHIGAAGPGIGGAVKELWKKAS